VNARFRENAEVTTRLMTPEQAVAAGAMALFGEKYGEEVRVVGMGHDAAATDRHGVYSLELCGGTHVRRTGDIGLFRILGEAAVSAGVRRIEAVTGEAALKLIEERDRQLNAAAAVLKARPGELAERVASLLEERRKLERDVAELRKKLATGGAAAEVETIAGLRVALRDMGEVPARDLRAWPRPS
jgi:alanyl-tRNA synthetase